MQSDRKLCSFGFGNTHLSQIKYMKKIDSNNLLWQDEGEDEKRRRINPTMWSYDPNTSILMPDDVTDSMLNRYQSWIRVRIQAFRCILDLDPDLGSLIKMTIYFYFITEAYVGLLKVLLYWGLNKDMNVLNSMHRSCCWYSHVAVRLMNKYERAITNTGYLQIYTLAGIT